MLASQTGLSRNQVSNWFINARVRVWKPMVEEIHMLETKGLAEPNSNLGKIDGEPNAENDHQPANKAQETNMDTDRTQNNGIRRSGSERNSVKSQLAWMVRSWRGGLEIGGLGAVSLTLGLRQSAEQLEQEEIQIRQHFGGQMIHDFVGLIYHQMNFMVDLDLLVNRRVDIRIQPPVISDAHPDFFGFRTPLDLATTIIATTLGSSSATTTSTIVVIEVLPRDVMVVVHTASWVFKFAL
ncbi:hypothetical protein HYC85_024110 [Camellia sinensis]|uniref:Homeobox domain-containing protein n=1 Tax=Camellia sinensis TaxID=4442 RepID=A0A7J7GB31_CAMSI|nr:hypothetical protein HYC85_024110 [Camellia sinensis]